MPIKDMRILIHIILLELKLIPCPASAQSTVKYVGSNAFRPVLATPGPDTLTLLGWHPAPIFIYTTNTVKTQGNTRSNKQQL